MNDTNLPFWANHKTAIDLYRAFERIVANKPEKVDVHARLSKTLVATEAGYQRSTLSVQRYPDLCRLIDESSSRNPRATSAAEKLEQKARANRQLKEKIAALQVRISDLESRYVSLCQAFADKCAQLRKIEQTVGAPKVVQLVNRHSDALLREP